MVEPVLQIVHVSDMHVVVPNHPGCRHLRRFENWLSKHGPKSWYDKLRDGTAPHDTAAPWEFMRFLRSICANDQTWSKRPLWIVDTGDQTTFGDDASIKLAQTELANFMGAAKGQAPVGVNNRVFGNHDAWPETMPWVNASAIPSQKVRIAATFHHGQATIGLCCALPSGGEIQLYTLDTVNFDWWENTWARGHVEPSQLQDLAALIAKSQTQTPSLRLLATHHPVHYPPTRPSYEMVLANDADVGNELARACPIHLVLSGHTHKLFPDHGNLPRSPRVCAHPTLGTDQAQLVVGSLTQVDRIGTRNHAHQCQVLRLYQDPAQPRLVIVERLVAARAALKAPGQTGGTGPYRFVPVPGGSGVAEEIELAL